MLTPLPPDREAARHQAERLATKLRQALAQPYELLLNEDSGVQRVVHHGSASVGVTVFGPDDDNAEAVLKRADQAMYRAKAAREPEPPVSGSR